MTDVRGDGQADRCVDGRDVHPFSVAEGKDFVAKARMMLESIGIGRTPAVPAVQADAVEKFVKVLQEFFLIKKLGGHREFPYQLGEGKICPGNVGLAFVKTLRAKLGLGAPG